MTRTRVLIKELCPLGVAGNVDNGMRCGIQSVWPRALECIQTIVGCKMSASGALRLVRG